MNHTSGIRELFLETPDDKAEYPPFDGVEGFVHHKARCRYCFGIQRMNKLCFLWLLKFLKHVQQHCWMISQIMSA